MIMLLALHIALVCSTSGAFQNKSFDQALIFKSFDQVHFKPEQSQFLSPDLHVTIGTIQQTQEAAIVL